MDPSALEPLAFTDLVQQQPGDVPWLWHGYVARGNITLLTSQWKSGKTTLVSILLSRLSSGGGLAGLDVQPARAAIVSEETPALWRRRGERLAFGPDVLFLCRPFPRQPTHADWLALVDTLAKLRAERRLDLAVIDPLSPFLPPGSENSADAMLTLLRPLQRLTEQGLAVLLLHHPRKGACHPGQAARGSGALCALVDIIIEMSRLPGTGSDDRRRRLSAWSRHDATPGELLVELSPDRCDYLVAPSSLEHALDLPFEHGLVVIQEVLARTGRQMTRIDVHKEWPERSKPSLATLWRWLERGFAGGTLAREGSGKNGDPFRYTLAGLDAEAWMPSVDDLLARFP